MIHPKVIKNRLKEIAEIEKQLEAEKDFLYDQLIEIRFEAESMEQCALEIMNGGEAHV